MRFSVDDPYKRLHTMIEHAFGGVWTEDKLKRLSKYLAAYRSVFAANPKARHFTTWYVDAFAGTGSRSTQKIPTQSMTDETYADAESSGFRDGSARIALSLGSPFDRYLFVEKSKLRITALHNDINRDFTDLAGRCELRLGDANKNICDWCQRRNWAKERAVVFLDPYGMQVEWSTVQALGSTRGVDLWYLFPLGVARMLTRNGNIEESWRNRLTTLFGTPDWEERFYKTGVLSTLFGDEEATFRDATVENIQGYIKERLNTAFHSVADSLILRNSKGSPLFALCFAAANERGAPLAMKIAKDILKG